jgi:hypothetical protein
MSATPRSRLLVRTEQELAAAEKAGLQRQHALRGQLAMLLIRQGENDAARDLLTQMHQSAFANPSPELGAWLHLAEGLMAYYTEFNASAYDRLLRAEALARSCGSREAQAQAHAYMAHYAMVLLRYEALPEHLSRGFALATPDDASARARLNLVAAMVLHHAGDAEGAAPWYARARSHAAQIGDDAMLSALIHNHTQMRVAEVRYASLQGREVRLDGLLPGVQSVHNFDRAMGQSALPLLAPLLQAQVLVVTGDYAQALEMFETHLPSALAMGLERMGSSLLADTAWCRAQLGQSDIALAQARASEGEIDQAAHLDDQAISHSRLAQVFEKLGLADDAQRHAGIAAQRWEAFAAEQQRWREAIRKTGLRPA